MNCKFCGDPVGKLSAKENKNWHNRCLGLKHPGKKLKIKSENQGPYNTYACPYKFRGSTLV